MRKEKLVTRSIEWKEVEVLGFNIETSSAENRVFTVPAKIKDENKVKEYIAKHNNDENFTPVKVLEITLKSELRGMPESTFIANSFPIENRHNANEKK